MNDRERRPDTSKNGLMKRNELNVRRDDIRERGKSVLSRLGQKQQKKTDEPSR